MTYWLQDPVCLSSEST